MIDYYGEPLQVLDPFLPLLASEAALELDGILLQQSLPFEPATKELAKLLRVSFFDVEVGQNSFTDSSVLTIIGGAMRAAHWNNAANDIAPQFHTLGQQLADQLEAVSSETPQTTVKKLREFCVQLSRFAIHYRQRLYPMTRESMKWSGGGLFNGSPAFC